MHVFTRVVCAFNEVAASSFPILCARIISTYPAVVAILCVPLLFVIINITLFVFIYTRESHARAVYCRRDCVAFVCVGREFCFLSNYHFYVFARYAVIFIRQTGRTLSECSLFFHDNIRQIENSTGVVVMGARKRSYLLLIDVRETILVSISSAQRISSTLVWPIMCVGFHALYIMICIGYYA